LNKYTAADFYESNFYRRNLCMCKAVIYCHCRSFADIWSSRSRTGSVSALPSTCFQL